MTPAPCTVLQCLAPPSTSFDVTGHRSRHSLIVQDAEAYQRLLHIAARADSEEGIRQGLDNVAHGRTRPAKEVFDDIRRKHGISH
jgi:predicted transcriptional regulator